MRKKSFAAVGALRAEHHIQDAQRLDVSVKRAIAELSRRNPKEITDVEILRELAKSSPTAFEALRHLDKRR